MAEYTEMMLTNFIRRYNELALLNGAARWEELHPTQRLVLRDAFRALADEIQSDMF